MKQRIDIKNKRATYDYEIVQEYTAGIELFGFEVKALQDGRGRITESHCAFNDNELFLYNSHINRYVNSSPFVVTYEEARPRKLLLKRDELNKLSKAVEQKGMTIIPLRLFRNDRGLIKVTIALAKGKHSYDKRESIKKRDIERESNLKF